MRIVKAFEFKNGGNYIIIVGSKDCPAFESDLKRIGDALQERFPKVKFVITNHHVTVLEPKK